MKCIFYFLLTVATIQLKAQTDSINKLTPLFWVSAGVSAGGNAPHPGSNGFPNLAGGHLGLHLGTEHFTTTLEGAGLWDGTDFISNHQVSAWRIQSQKSISISAGPRFNFGNKSLIPSLGIIAGNYDYRQGTKDTTYGKPYVVFSTERFSYSHEQGSFVGLLLNISYLIHSSDFGGQFSAFCNVNKYTTFGASASIAFGDISGIRKKRYSTCQ
jgi:hypothetical protein